MQVQSTGKDEGRRLAALADHQLLDTSDEEVFDALADAAAAVCSAPIATIGLIDRERIWFKAVHGLPGVRELPRDGSFGALVLNRGEMVEIADATADKRFGQNPLVKGQPHLRFYAGYPLLSDEGLVLGTLSVLDTRPRALTPEQRAALAALTDAVRRQLRARRAHLNEKTEADERIQLLSGAMEACEDAVVISRPGKQPTDAPSIVYANEAFLREKGATGRDQVVGRDADSFYGPKTDADVVRDMYERLLRGEPARAEFVSYRLDGSYYYASVAGRPLVNARGQVTHFVLIQHDITESVLRGAQLAMQNERLTALTSIARGIFAALEPHALVEALLSGVHELVGARATLLVARPNGGFAATRDLVVPERAPAAGDSFVEAASRSEVTMLSDDDTRAAIRIPGSLGQTRYILDVRSERPLHTADVFALGLLGQYFAVAARNVELYGELQARRAAVVELNQVKNDLIAMLAHDFKGPLTTIVGFADVLAEDDRFDDESRKFLSMISSSAMRLASLATDTLAMSRLEQNELTLTVEDFDLVTLVRDIVRVFSVTRSIELRTDRPELRIGGDPARLRQVFENLIGNAIKYSPNGEPVDVFLRAKGRGVEVSVRDQGIGIPAADKPKLFGRFARAQNARAMGIGGTGFGLYLTKTIVEMHGGSIAVESRENEGSTFRVFLPAKVAATRPQHRRFVLIDPNGDAKSYVAHTLRDDGYAATVVADGAALLATIDETQFDAALVDIDFIGMPLEEFVRRVSGRTALIRIDAVEVEETPGWDGYLVKPFLTKDLQAAIDAAIMRHPRPKREVALSFGTA